MQGTLTMNCNGKSLLVYNYLDGSKPFELTFENAYGPIVSYGAFTICVTPIVFVLW